MTTSDYLEQLQQDREDLVDNLETMGITGLTGDETFTELVPEVLNISGGGISTPTTLDELNQGIVDLAVSFENYLKSLPSTYTTYTNNPVTLYTPNADFQYYTIHKRSNGKYRIGWQNFPIISKESTMYAKLAWSGTLINQTGLINIEDIFPTDGAIRSISDWGDYYYSQEYNTINDCIQAIQSSSTTYTGGNFQGLGCGEDTPYVIPYTNCGVIKQSTKETLLSQKISSNETITAIS